MINRALEIACKAHYGQVDKGGNPYIFHPVRVALNCNTQQEKIVALLHDVVEDTPITIEDLRMAGFTNDTIEAIKCLTKIKGEEYGDLIKRVSMNKIAIQVKIQDLKDNMDVSRLNGRKPWKLEVYKEALEYLEGVNSNRRIVEGIGTMNKRKEFRDKLKKGKKVFLVDEIDEIAFDFTDYPRLRVKSKGGKIVERNYTGIPCEFRAVSALIEISEEEFKKY